MRKLLVQLLLGAPLLGVGVWSCNSEEPATVVPEDGMRPEKAVEMTDMKGELLKSAQELPEFYIGDDGYWHKRGAKGVSLEDYRDKVVGHTWSYGKCSHIFPDGTLGEEVEDVWTGGCEGYFSVLDENTVRYYSSGYGRLYYADFEYSPKSSPIENLYAKGERLGPYKRVFVGMIGTDTLEILDATGVYNPAYRKMVKVSDERQEYLLKNAKHESEWTPLFTKP